mmetsp:Transcript_17278/g.31730  ORF Transcript_17278/g.31730 Transcript_17278/m.31730 type:complete len:234 (+) Transcript_17278:142-843(+)
MASVVNRAVGMMDDAYFVGRKQILDWLNDLLQLKLTKIEETASGAVACQVMDALFPGKVPMSKVNWGAKTDYEFVANYKVLQSVFAKLSISRAIEVDRLIRARYQDNLEFMQWLKKFFEDNYSNCVEDYEPLAQRAKGKNVNMYIPAQGGAPVKKRVSSREVKQQFHKSAPKKIGYANQGEQADRQHSAGQQNHRTQGIERWTRGFKCRCRARGRGEDAQGTKRRFGDTERRL